MQQREERARAAAPSTLLVHRHGTTLLLAFIAVYTALVLDAVAGLPFTALLRDLSKDDSFYYFQIARNLAEGRFSSFDGVNPTNGHHPLWTLLLTPFFWLLSTPEAAVAQIKFFEITLLGAAMLLLVVTAWRLGVPWVLWLALPSALLGRTRLYCGMESAAHLLLLVVVLATLTRALQTGGRRASLALAVSLGALPWVRLESAAIAASIPVGLAVLPASPRLPRRVVWAAALGAAGGTLLYLAYNALLFDSLLPISGRVKTELASVQRWRVDGGFDLLANAAGLWSAPVYRLGLPRGVLVLGLAAASLALGSRRGAWRARHLPLDLFMAALVFGHLAKFVHSALFVHWKLAVYPWYFVAHDLLATLWLPYLLYTLHGMAGLAWGSQGRGWRDAGLGALAVLLLLFASARAPFARFDGMGRSQRVDWEITSYRGARVLNELPEGSVIGVLDAGVVGFFSGHRVVNLDGLVNSRVYFDALRARRVDTWIAAEGITHLANIVPPRARDGARFFGRRLQGRPLAGRSVLSYEGPPLPRGRRFRIWSYAPAHPGAGPPAQPGESPEARADSMPGSDSGRAAVSVR